VDAFHRAGQWKRLNQFPFAAFGSGEAKDRAQSFAANKQTVAHRFMDRGRRRVFLWQETIQRPIDHLLSSDQIRFQVHGRLLDAGSRMLDAQRENWWHAHEILGSARNARPAWSSDALGKLFPKFFLARALIF